MKLSLPKIVLAVSLVLAVAAPAYFAGQAGCAETTSVELSQELIDRIAASCSSQTAQECLSSSDVKRLITEALDEYPVPSHGSDCKSGDITLVPEPVARVRHHLVPGLAVLGDDGYSFGYRFQPQNREWSVGATYVNLDTDFVYTSKVHEHRSWKPKTFTQEVETDAILIQFDVPITLITKWFK